MPWICAGSMSSPGTPRSSSHSVLHSPGALIYNVDLSDLKSTFSWLQSRIPSPPWLIWVNLNAVPSISAISSSFLSLLDLIYISLNMFSSLYGLKCWLGQDQGQCQVMTSHFSRLTGYSYLAELLLMGWPRSQPTITSMAKSWEAQTLCWGQDDQDCGKRWGLKQGSCYWCLSSNYQERSRGCRESGAYSSKALAWDMELKGREG